MTHMAQQNELEVVEQAIDPPTVLEKAVLIGDLSKLKPIERLEYYRATCDSMGLNPLTRPFQYISLNNKLTLYATKNATDQLRSVRGISITDAVRDDSDPNYATWVVTGRDKTGRTDMDIGSVSIAKLQGENRANAIMKALTKAKRRVTLSLAGLSMLDESEVDSVPSATPVQVDPETGEVVAAPRATRMLVERAQAQAEAPQEEAPPDHEIRTLRDAEPETGTTTGTTERSHQRPPTAPTGEDTAPPQDDGVPPMLRPRDDALCLAENTDLDTGKCEKPAGHDGAHGNAAGVWPA